jgi:dolichyl-phosphate-mannose-protein mannosyltransferase
VPASLSIGEATGRGQACRLDIPRDTTTLTPPTLSLRRSWALGVLVLVVLATVGIRLRLLGIPLDRDEGEYAYFGQLLLQGVLPYTQAYNFKMPGIYAIYALILALFGQTPAGIHLGLLVVSVVTIVLVFLVARRLFDARVAAVAAAAFAALSLNPKLLCTAAYAEHFVLPPILAGALVLLHAADGGRIPAFLGSGALLGAAFLVKQSGGAFLPFAVLYVLLGARGDTRRRLAASAALVAGALAPFATVCLIMLLAGTFANFWFWTFTYASTYAMLMPLGGAPHNLWAQLHRILPTSYLIAGLACLGLSALFWDREARSRGLFLALFLGASFLGTSAGLWFRRQYFILLLPVVAILAGVAVDAVTRRLSPVRLRALRHGIPVVLTVVALLHPVYLERAILFTDTPHEAARAIYGLNPFPESVEIARYIRERTSPDDRIAVVGSEPQIYFYAQRRAATGYVYTYALMESQPYAAAMQRQMIREIEAMEPRFVVFVRIWASWLLHPESDVTIFRWFDEYQAKKLKKVGVVEIIPPDRTTYVWGQEAAAYTPRSDLWLEVYERRDGAR